MSSTLTRPVTGTFTVEPLRPGVEWLKVTFQADSLASASLSPEYGDYEHDYYGDPIIDPDLPRTYGVWSVKVVDEGQRGRGLGTALMANLVTHADRNQWDLFLKCQPHVSGDWIIGFYERFGFRVTQQTVEDQPTYTMCRDAQPTNA